MGIGKKGTVSPILTQLTKDYQKNMKALREPSISLRFSLRFTPSDSMFP